MARLKIAVKFCGHCAPHMDMRGFYDDLCERMPGAEFGFYCQDPSGDVLLVLSACGISCVNAPPFPGPVIRVRPGEVQRQPVSGALLLQETVSALEKAARAAAG